MPATHPSLRRRPPPPAPATSPGPPPLARDPWALAVAAGVLAVLFAARGAPLGEPAADDYLFLDHSVLRGNPSWWDGGGGLAYWRPLARQAYYGALGPLLLAHPLAVAVLHALALAAAGVLLHRALRRGFPAPAAALAASFPVVIEGARTLLAWPSGAQDLGALLFLSLALHATARGRGALAAVAGVAAALCKEVAGPLALLAAFAPFPRPAGLGRRGRLAVSAALAAWAIARFALPHFGGSAGVTWLAPPLSSLHDLPARLLRAAVMGARDAFSLDRLPAWAVAVAAAAALVPLALARGPRRAGAWRWMGWGLAWFALGALPLAIFLPDWAAFRCAVPAFGLGVTLAAPLAAAAATFVMPIAAVRLAALLAAAPANPVLQSDASDAGAALSFARITQLQLAVRGARVTLAKAAPRLERGSRVLRENWPRMTGVAFAGDRSLRAWYRDTTLAWAGPDAFGSPGSERTAAMVEFEPGHVPLFAWVSPGALRATDSAFAAMYAERYPAALPFLVRAESLLADTTAACFRANLAGWRADCLFRARRLAEAEAQAELAMRRWADDPNGRFVLAEARFARGQWREAIELLEQHLVPYPDDQDARRLIALARSHVGPDSGGAPPGD